MEGPFSCIVGVLACLTATVAVAQPEGPAPAAAQRPEGPEPPPAADAPDPARPPFSSFAAEVAPTPVVVGPFEADPLADPTWQRRSRRLTVATATLGGLTGAAFAGFVTSRALTVVLGGPVDGPVPATRPGYEAASTASLVTVIVDGALALALIGVAAAREHHLERAVNARVPDRRIDATWQSRDRTLTVGLWTAATVAGAGGVCFTTFEYFGPGDAGGLIALPLCGVVGGASLIAMAVLGRQRIRHRRGLDRWPRLAGNGLSWRF